MKIASYSEQALIDDGTCCRSDSTLGSRVSR